MELVHYEPIAPSDPQGGPLSEGVDIPQVRHDWAADCLQPAIPAISPELAVPVGRTADAHG
jgi:hypothetical protein